MTPQSMDAAFVFSSANVASTNNVQVCLKNVSLGTVDPGAVSVFVMVYIP